MIFVAQIIEAVAQHHGISAEAIKSPSRKREDAWPRQEVMYLAGQLTKHSSVRIGQFLNRDHSTVLSGAKRAEQRVIADNETREAVRRIARLVLAGAEA